MFFRSVSSFCGWNRSLLRKVGQFSPFFDRFTRYSRYFSKYFKTSFDCLNSCHKFKTGCQWNTWVYFQFSILFFFVKMNFQWIFQLEDILCMVWKLLMMLALLLLGLLVTQCKNYCNTGCFIWKFFVMALKVYSFHYFFRNNEDTGDASSIQESSKMKRKIQKVLRRAKTKLKRNHHSEVDSVYAIDESSESR